MSTTNEEAPAVEKKSTGGFELWIVIIAALIGGTCLVVNAVTTKKSTYSSDRVRPATQRAEMRQSAGEMTPQVVETPTPRDCPQVDMTPPARRPAETDSTWQPPRANNKNYITLPNARGTTRIPGPVGEEWTKWVRVPTRAGRTLRPHSEPREADWIQDDDYPEDSEGYRPVRWRHKEGAIRAETVVLVVD